MNTWNGFEWISIDSYRGILYIIMKLQALERLEFIHAFCGNDGRNSAAGSGSTRLPITCLPSRF
jgi:hypothetical protein